MVWRIIAAIIFLLLLLVVLTCFNVCIILLAEGFKDNSNTNNQK